MPASEPDEPYHRTNGRGPVHDQLYKAVHYFHKTLNPSPASFSEAFLLNGQSLVSWFISLYCPYRSRLSTIIAQKAPHVFARFCELGCLAVSCSRPYRLHDAVVVA